MAEEERIKMKDEFLQSKIDAEHRKGYLEILECKIKGQLKKEIFFSTYLCHPSMANNELSGPALMDAIIKYVEGKKNKYTYRFVILPETIGSIAYLYKRHRTLKSRVIAGFNLTCVGDDRAYSYVCSPSETTIADEAIKVGFIKNRMYVDTHITIEDQMKDNIVRH